jgi:hypothetical protein
MPDAVDVRSLFDQPAQCTSDWAFSLTPETLDLAANIDRLAEVIVDEARPMAQRLLATTAASCLQKAVVRAAPLAEPIGRLRTALEVALDDQDSTLKGQASYARRMLDIRATGTAGTRKTIHSTPGHR